MASEEDWEKLDERIAELGRVARAIIRSSLQDARAEEIAQRLETALMGDLRCTPASFGADAARIARSTINKPEKPKTREQVLEEALRMVPVALREKARMARSAGANE